MRVIIPNNDYINLEKIKHERKTKHPIKQAPIINPNNYV